MSNEEFTPLDHFIRLTRLWWVIVLSIILGGIGGYIFSRAHPTKYEAVSSIYVAIDMAQLPGLNINKDQLQYNEDLAISVVENALRDPVVIASVYAQLQSQNLPVTQDQIAYDTLIQRRHAFWDICFRHTDPAVAQAVANLWSQTAYQTLLTWRAEGKVKDYLIFEAPVPAQLPIEPSAFQLYQLIVAGSLIGLIVGIILSNVFAAKN